MTDPTAPYRTESRTDHSQPATRARPSRKPRSQPSATLVPDADPAAVAGIQLNQVEILLDLKRPADARQAMPPTESIAARDRPLAAFLEAQLLLHEGNPAEAQADSRNSSIARRASRCHSITRRRSVSPMPSRRREIRMQPRNRCWRFSRIIRTRPILESHFPTHPALAAGKTHRHRPDARTDRPVDHPARAASHRPDLDQPVTSGAVMPLGPFTPSRTNRPSLLAFSLYTRAIGLHQIGTPEARAEARRLLYRLRIEYPEHTLDPARALSAGPLVSG